MSQIIAPKLEEVAELPKDTVPAPSKFDFKSIFSNYVALLVIVILVAIIIWMIIERNGASKSTFNNSNVIEKKDLKYNADIVIRNVQDIVKDHSENVIEEVKKLMEPKPTAEKPKEKTEESPKSE